MPNPRDIEAMIFDLDGVIADTVKYHFQSWQKMAHAIGAELTWEQNEKLRGLSRMASLEKILFWNSIDLSDEHKATLADFKNTQYLKLIDELGPKVGFPAAIEFLKSAKERGYGIALGSGSKNADALLRIIEIDHLFDVVIDGNVVDESKPHPQVFLMGAEALGVDPAHIIVFDDAVYGIEAAREGGFISVGVGKEKDLSIADLVIPALGALTVSQLIQQIENHPDLS